MSQEFSSIRDAMDGYLSPALEPISVALQYVPRQEILTLTYSAKFLSLERKRLMKD